MTGEARSRKKTVITLSLTSVSAIIFILYYSNWSSSLDVIVSPSPTPHKSSILHRRQDADTSNQYNNVSTQEELLSIYDSSSNLVTLLCLHATGRHATGRRHYKLSVSVCLSVCLSVACLDKLENGKA